MRRNVKEIGKSLSAAAAFTTASSRRSHPPLPQLPSAATAASSRHWHHSAAQQPPQLSARQPCSALPFAAQQRTSCSAAVCRVKHVFFHQHGRGYPLLLWVRFPLLFFFSSQHSVNPLKNVQGIGEVASSVSSSTMSSIARAGLSIRNLSTNFPVIHVNDGTLVPLDTSC